MRNIKDIVELFGAGVNEGGAGDALGIGPGILTSM